MIVRARKALLAVAAVIPCAALADGLPAPPPAPPPPAPVGCCEPFVWTGVYLGIQAGAVWGEPRWSFPFLESFNTAPGENFSVSASGAAFGGHIGGNYQIGRIVLGAEVAYSENGEFGRVTGPFAALPFEQFSFKTTDLFTASGRLGYAHDQFLFYGKVGYANARVEIGANSGAGTVTRVSQREDGWTIGGGFDARMVSNILFGVEYSYSDLAGGRFSGVTSGLVPGAPFNVEISGAQVQTVMARFSILFGPTSCCGEGLLGKY